MDGIEILRIHNNVRGDRTDVYSGEQRLLSNTNKGVIS